MVVDVVLPAVLGLVLVREAGVEALREEGCGLADWDVLVSRYGRIVVFGGYVCCVPAVKMSVSVSVSLSRLAGLICYAPVTNLKGMVTRSSSSDMFAVFLGGLDWVVCWWIGGPVLSLSLWLCDREAIEGRRGGRRGSGSCTSQASTGSCDLRLQAQARVYTIPLID